MKNKTALYASVIALCACFATPAISDTTVECTKTCDGGKCFKGAVNEHEYCRSSTGMPWWAAFQWCQEQGRHLVTLQEACVDWMGATGDNACPNLKVGDNIYIWTANPNGSSSAYNVNLSSGGVNLSIRANNYCALCF